jgi:hypothetical protein
MPAIHENTVSEYRVRPVTRYVVTRYRFLNDTESQKGSCGSECLGEFDRSNQAYAVAYALASEETRTRELSPGDERVMYPQEVAETSGNIIGDAIESVLPQAVLDATR